MRFFKLFLTLLSASVLFAFLYVQNRISGVFVVIALVFYFLASSIHLVFHEIGHLIGGAVSGYRLLRLQLGPVNLVIQEGGRPALFWKGSLSGQCIMIPQRDPVRFIAYNLGGVFANLSVTALSFILLPFDSFYVTLLFTALLCIGMQKILVNAIPHKTNAAPNDGYIVKLLKKDPAIQKDYGMYLRLYSKLFLEEPITPGDYLYERRAAKDPEELLYYHEIQDILQSLEAEST